MHSVRIKPLTKQYEIRRSLFDSHIESNSIRERVTYSAGYNSNVYLLKQVPAIRLSVKRGKNMILPMNYKNITDETYDQRRLISRNSS